MFFIVNKTKQTIVLNDMGVTLGPRQAVDLDKIVPRSKSDSSKYLKMAKKNGHIEVRTKDGEKPKHPDKQPQAQPLSLDGFKKEIVDEIKTALSKQSQPTAVSGLDKKDLAEFAKEIISNIPKSTETVIYKQGQEDIRQDEEVEIDELGEMNKRVIDRMVENVKSVEIEHNEEIQKNDLDNNIAELEGLIDL